MIDMDTVLGAITAGATLVIAWAAVRQLPLIVAQVRWLAQQIEQASKADRAAEERKRVWQTVDRMQSYTTNPVFDAAAERVWVASNEGQDYKSPNVKKRDIIVILNFLNGIATGVRQELYVKEIVHDNLREPIKAAVEDFIHSGIVSEEGYESLLWLYDEWYKQTQPPAYRR